jgi:hypothetical protein
VPIHPTSFLPLTFGFKNAAFPLFVPIAPSKIALTGTPTIPDSLNAGAYVKI